MAQVAQFSSTSWLSEVDWNTVRLQVNYITPAALGFLTQNKIL